MPFGMLLCFLVLSILGILVGLVFFLLPLFLVMYVSGRILLGFWSSWLLSWVLFNGPLGSDLRCGGISYVELLIL